MTTLSILIPHDGSPASGAVIDALGPLLASGARVTLLYVDEGTGREKDAALADAKRRLAEAGVTLSVEHTVSKDPASAIVEVAEEQRPDLVAMSTHGQSGQHQRVRGGVAERVLRACPIPLFMANPFAERPTQFTSILVPLEPTPESAEILGPLVPIAKSVGARLTFLFVDFDDPTDTAEQRERRRADRAQDVESWLADPRKRAEDAGISVELRIAHGTPWTEILEATESGQYDLLAMTTHARSGVSRWAFGSVAERVLRACTIPVLVHRMGRD